MEAWIEWARGPLFWAALTFMVLGLLRHLVLTLWEIRRAVRRAGDKDIPYKKVAVATVKWLVPFDKMGNRVATSVTSVVFHISILLVPVFLIGHIELWKRGTGMSWPAIPNIVADVLTILAVITAIALVVERVTARASRGLSRFQDYAIPLIIAVPFISGFMVKNHAWNPFSFEVAMLIHVMSANLVLFLVPLTKISHCVLLPLTQLVSEVAWRFPPDAGSKVGADLGKEGEAV